ncbi:LT_GEWL domain containing protein [uncultured Caudovirales phage]|uniref:LT_GEWL domain containing protein n=1 Tax=uncultured Caudovirales phage TaxID=2100421 RepID=A0A6J5MMN4_9CAUD|nr:LT_GEWL domain containing protein [uncultured Caudovirales phage]CAB4178689.1 LT_GEWL domain containing protein [uncultured Caudovirales phage]CAB4187977.1 LT_GEWL domain containing protein [uncultured Caudovirales phage]CAB4220356.1 LT_GEWL domain containing protein [uncultured Caudovirales phage]
MSGIIFPNVAGTLAPLMQLNQSDERNALLREESDARKSAAPFIQRALSGDPNAQNELATRHPDTLIKIQTLINSMDANKRAKVKEDADFITQNGMAILNAPPEAQRQLYDRVRREAEASGRNVSQWPTQYDSGWVKFNVDKATPIAEHLRRSGEGVTYGPPTADGKTAPAEWDQHFNAASTTYGVPIPLIKAVAGTESMFNPNAVSPAGAGGVMQIMPGTAADLGVTNRFDVGQSINKGTAYLKQQMDRFGNLDHALVAYNWGPGNAEKWVAAGANPAALPAETRNYITKVKSNLQAQTAQPGGPGVPQGGDPPPAGDGSGIPVQPGQGQPIPHELLKGVELPAGYRIGTQNGKIFSPVPGYVQVMPPGGGAPILWPMPKPKEQGAGPFAGTGMEQQATNILIMGNPSSPEYAAAYAHMKAPRTTMDEQGRPVTIQPDVSHFRPPTPRGGVMPVAPGAAPGAAPVGSTQLPGGGTATVGQPVAPKGPTPKEIADLKAARTEAATIVSALVDFQDTFKGSDWRDRAKSVAGMTTPLNTSYNVAALLAKGEQLFNLGVLNGPDLDIIRRTLPDPSTFRGAGTDSTDMSAAVGKVIDLLQTRLAAKEKQLGLDATDVRREAASIRSTMPGATDKPTSKPGTYLGPDQRPISWAEIENTAKGRKITTDEVIRTLGLQPTGMQ